VLPGCWHAAAGHFDLLVAAVTAASSSTTSHATTAAVAAIEARSLQLHLCFFFLE